MAVSFHKHENEGLMSGLLVIAAQKLIGLARTLCRHAPPLRTSSDGVSLFDAFLVRLSCLNIVTTLACQL